MEKPISAVSAGSLCPSSSETQGWVSEDVCPLVERGRIVGKRSATGESWACANRHSFATSVNISLIILFSWCHKTRTTPNDEKLNLSRTNIYTFFHAPSGFVTLRFFSHDWLPFRFRESGITLQFSRVASTQTCTYIAHKNLAVRIIVGRMRRVVVKWTQSQHVSNDTRGERSHKVPYASIMKGN